MMSEDDLIWKEKRGILLQDGFLLIEGIKSNESDAVGKASCDVEGRKKLDVRLMGEEG